MVNKKEREKKWFCEDAVPGKRFGKIRHCFLMENLIFKGKSKYQEILIFDNHIYGRILALDGIVQFSQKDEHIYHEMIVHPIFFSHPKAKKILIIGGGDGGVLREVLKHKIKKVWLVEIDKKVVQVSKKYLPFVSQGAFEHKSLKIFFQDGAKFIKNKKNFFDIVIVDSTDPMGKAISLFSDNFYKNVFESLKKDGMAMFQVGSFLDFDTLIKETFLKLKKFFYSVQIFRITIPSYHCGEYCFMAVSKKIDLEKIDFRKIEKRFKDLEKKKIEFKYYSPKIHKASLILPKEWKERLRF